VCVHTPTAMVIGEAVRTCGVVLWCAVAGADGVSGSVVFLYFKKLL
jgi:hypothetical protein